MLIILATISINIVFSDNGIIARAEQARDFQANAEAKEQEALDTYDEWIGSILGEVKEVTFNEATQDSMLDEDYNSKIVLEDGTVYIPAGFKLHEDTAEVVDEGIVITDGTNEFVWVPVSEASYNNMFAEGTVALSGSTGVSSSYYSKLRVRTGDTYVPAIVSSGAYAPAEGKTTLGLREPDLVTTYDEDTTNEYYKQAGFSSSKAMAEGFVDDYKAMRESIKTYGGFYIGRYELTGTVDTPTVKAGAVLDAGSSEAKNWYGLYKACREVVTGNEHAVTTMIWGCQWDETMNWLKNTKFKNNPDAVDTDSSSWGNYKDYNTTNGYEEGNEKYVAEAGTLQDTGFSAHWSANNIYDLAGNYNDFTQEATGTFVRIKRGRLLPR